MYSDHITRNIQMIGFFVVVESSFLLILMFTPDIENTVGGTCNRIECNLSFSVRSFRNRLAIIFRQFCKCLLASVITME